MAILLSTILLLVIAGGILVLYRKENKLSSQKIKRYTIKANDESGNEVSVYLYSAVN